MYCSVNKLVQCFINKQLDHTILLMMLFVLIANTVLETHNTPQFNLHLNFERIALH